MRNFLPHVKKVVEDAKRKKKTTVDQLDYIFNTLGGICIKPATELTVKELVSWAYAFGLDPPRVAAKEKPKRKHCSLVFD